MVFGNKARLALGVLALGCVVGGSGCAEERDPINQVQLGVLPKRFFVGEKLEDASDDPEFYYRTTVVDVSAGAGSESLFTSTDSQPTTRVRWEITETKLIARLSYELIDGTDQKGSNGAPKGDEPRSTPTKKAPARTTTDGQIVASFAISKHFDIRRGYNVQTGEEQNVIEENDRDRPWNQREYIRVDWSQNLVTDAYDLDAASQMGLYGSVKWDPIAYHISDTNSPDAPVYDIQNGYLDVTQKAFAAPQVIHDEEFGDFPACWLVGEFPRTSCNPSEVKMRLAFRKVVDSDYEPMDMDGRKMEIFGYFTNDRFGYDRKYGVVDEKWHRFASRWNVWEKSHAEKSECATADLTPAGADPHRDDDKDGTEDECASVGRGSRCDEFTRKCTIPLRDRKVKTIAWTVNREYPAELWEAGKKVIDTWSNGVRVGIAAGRLAECRRTKDGDCEGQVGWPARWSDDWTPSAESVPPVFVLCHNPVVKDDHPACGKPDTSPRMGDLRYNFFNYITSPQISGPWGIMVDAEDPLTGEKISGSVNQWGHTLDRAAGQLVDLVELLNGVTSPEAFIEGRDVSDWVRANRAGGKGEREVMGPGELSERMASFDPKVMAPFASKAGKISKGPPLAKYRARMKELDAQGIRGAGNTEIAQRPAKLRGSSIEAKMVTPEVMQLAGFDPKSTATKATIDRATPLGRNNPLMRRAMEKRTKMGLANRHACRREGPEADHLLGLARRAQRMFGNVDPKDAIKVKEHRDNIFKWAKEQYFVGVMSHEFGHSMGLRHNFAGTFDSLNYDDHYWELRTKGGSVTKVCAAGNTDGAGCVGPRYNDPLTDEEINQGINGFATTSVMDYPGDQSLDMYLIGKYDRAALRFGYGNTVDVWAAQGVSVNGSGDGKRKAYELTAFGDSPSLFGVKSFSVPDSEDSKYLHYSQYASEFGLIEGCNKDDQSPTGTTCKGAPLDVVDYRDMKDFAPIAAYASFFSTPKVVDPQGRVRRGYMFSSDEYADSGNVPSFAYDAGADPYEQIRFLESAYENRYILDAFRRGRTMFNSYSVLSRVQSHYLDAIQNMAKTYGFAMVLEADDPTKPNAQLLADGNYGPLAVGTSVAFDMFARMLTRPEPGMYCSTADQNCPNSAPWGLTGDIFMADAYPLPGSTAYSFKVPLGAGRFIHNDFDYNQGYWWSDYQKQVGSFYDKIWAIYYLTEAFDNFISNSKEDFVDGRYKNINFATIYPEQVRRLLGALMTGDIETFAPHVDATGAGTPTANVVYPAWRNVADVGTRPAKPKIVDPAFGFNEQLYAMVWSTMFLPATWSDQFIKDARITALANEQLSWPAAETYTFLDPATSITYRAHTTGTEKLFGVDHEKSLGARMLEWANNLVYTAYLVETDAQGYYLLNPDGTPKLKLKAGKPQLNPDFPGGDAALARYVTNLDVMRQLVSTYVRPVEDSLPSP